MDKKIKQGIGQLDDDEFYVEDIEKAIREIVEESSGGIKFVELLVKLNIRFSLKLPGPEKIEEIVRNTPGVKVLDYIWKSENRSKMFVYTD